MAKPQVTVLYVTGQDGVERIVPDPATFGPQREQVAANLAALEKVEADLLARLERTEGDRLQAARDGELLDRIRNAGLRAELDLLYQKRFALREQAVLLDQLAARLRELLDGAPAGAIRQVAYRFHAYTVNERLDARAEATTRRGSEQVYEHDVFRREIVARCVENLGDLHPNIEAGDLPSSLVASVGDAILKASEPTLDDLAFTLGWPQTSPPVTQ